MSLPVRQVVACTKVAPARRRTRDTEVGRLVPAVARAFHRCDDALEVHLDRVRLPRELLAVRVRESGPRLRLELVPRQVLRPQL